MTLIYSKMYLNRILWTLQVTLHCLLLTHVVIVMSYAKLWGKVQWLACGPIVNICLEKGTFKLYASKFKVHELNKGG